MQINSHKPPLRRDQWIQISLNADNAKSVEDLFDLLESWLPDGVEIEGELAQIRADVVAFNRRPDDRVLSRRA